MPHDLIPDVSHCECFVCTHCGWFGPGQPEKGCITDAILWDGTPTTWRHILEEEGRLRKLHTKIKRMTWVRTNGSAFMCFDCGWQSWEDERECGLTKIKPYVTDQENQG